MVKRKARGNMTTQPAQPSTLSQSISKTLSEDIVGGVLPPGFKLDEQMLAERFNVSRTPVRDALHELATTRLVQYQPRKGFSVAQIDTTSLDDMFEAATEIESMCARLCALRASSTNRARLESIFHEGQEAAAAEDAKRYAELDQKFHAAIYAGTHNDTIAGIAAALRQRLAPFRQRVFFTVERIGTSAAEHRTIMEAILAQDKSAAEAAMRKHTARAAINVTQHFAKLSAHGAPE